MARKRRSTRPRFQAETKGPEMQMTFPFDDTRIDNAKPRRDSLQRYLPALLAQHGHTCYLCGLDMRPATDPLHVDHLIPRHHGGANEWNNYRPTHAVCNIFRADLMLDDPRLPEQIAKAKVKLLHMRTFPKEKNCIECGGDISNLSPNRWYCIECREIKNKAKKRRWYAQNPGYKGRYLRQRCATDPAFHARKKAQASQYARRRYATDPAYRDRERERARLRRVFIS